MSLYSYPEIRALEVEFLQNHIIVSNGQGIRDQLPTWLEAMEEARLPKGASQIISLLISKLCTDVTAPKRCRYGCGGVSAQTYCSNCGRYS